LEEDGGRDLVHGAASLEAGRGGGVEDALGLDGGEAFIPVFDREVGETGEGRTPLADESGLAAFGAAHVAGKAEQPKGGLVFGGEGLEGEQIGVAAAAFEGGERLGGEAEGIAEGDADAAGAQIESEDAVGQQTASIMARGFEHPTLAEGTPSKDWSGGDNMGDVVNFRARRASRGEKRQLRRDDYVRGQQVLANAIFHWKNDPESDARAGVRFLLHHLATAFRADDGPLQPRPVAEEQVDS